MLHKYLADGDAAVAYAPDPEDEDQDEQDADAPNAADIPQPGTTLAPVAGGYGDTGAAPAAPTDFAIPGMPGVGGAMLEQALQAAPLPPPASIAPPSTYSQDLAALRAAQMPASATNPNGYPVRPQPKWWERVAAGALGGAAGYSNAARRAAPIDIQKATEPLLYPGYDSKLASWQSRVVPLDAAAKISGEQVAAQYAGQKNQSEAALKQAQVEYYQKRGQYYGSLNPSRLVTVDKELSEASGNIYKIGQQIPAAAAEKVVDIVAGKFQKPEKTIAVTDPALAQTMGVAVGTKVPNTLYQTAVTANARRSGTGVTTTMLDMRAAGIQTGNQQADAIAPGAARAARRAGADPLTDELATQRLSDQQQKTAEGIDTAKQNDERAIESDRMRRLGVVFGNNAAGIDKAAAVAQINGEAQAALQARQDRYARDIRARGGSADDYEVKIMGANPSAPQGAQFGTPVYTKRQSAPITPVGTGTVLAPPSSLAARLAAIRNGSNGQAAQAAPAVVAPPAQQVLARPTTPHPAIGGPVTVTLPGGRMKTFPNQAALDSFSKESGVAFTPAH